MSLLSDLRPRAQHRMFDLAEEAGLDMSDWRNSVRNPLRVKANPKYCYEWAYIEPGKLIILNLWHPRMIEDRGKILHRGNSREDAEFHRTQSRKQAWARRAQRADDAIRTAIRDKLQVRVVLLDGDMRRKLDMNAEPSHVTRRELDPEPWTITQYDPNTGAFELTRGMQTYVDQFDLQQATNSQPERKEATGYVFVRDAVVRRRVLRRAAGCCELCGQEGFLVASGALYLETHHVISLGEGGSDEDANVVALCANDHRRAHFADNRAAIKNKLLEYLSSLPAQ